MSATPAAVDVLEGPKGPHASEAPHLLRRLIRRPVAVACLIYLAIIVGIAIVAPLVMPWVNQEQAGDLFNVRQGPTSAHLLGTDSLGRDELERLLVGTRITLIAVAEALAVHLAISVPVGVMAGYFGGRTDRVVGSLVDFSLALPGLIIVLVVISVFPGNTFAAMVTFAILAAPGTIRLVRSAVLPVREELYVAAAHVSGLSRSYIMARHIMPRITGIIIVTASLFAAGTLLVEAGLAFLGLLGAPPAPSWGQMLQDGTQNIVLQPWLIWPPGIAITLTVLAFGLLGDVLSDATAETWQSTAMPKKEGRALSALLAMRRRPDRNRASTEDAVPAGVALTDPPAAPRTVAPARSQPTRVDGVPAAALSTSAPLLAMKGVSIAFASPQGPIGVVDDVSFEVLAGETVGVVGESGCGKTVTGMSILGLLPGSGYISSGRIMFDGRDLAALSEKELNRLRGKQIGLISQEPMVALNPVYRIGSQLADRLRVHHGLSRRAARSRAIELLARVHLPDPEAVARRYPHELSGGMAQRVAIARALSGDPKLLIADEPTTALDVTVQAEILALLRELQSDHGMAILLITHDWGVVADIADRVVVMYAGQVVERAEIAPIFHQPLHPYTQALLHSNPHHASEAEILPTIPGVVPKPGAWPHGCHFHPRCAFASAECREQLIALESLNEHRETRCIHYKELAVGT